MTSTQRMFWVNALLAAAVLAIPARVDAEDEEVDEASLFSDVSDIQAEEIPILQNRKYEQLHELSLHVGTYPADPYYKGLAVSAGYTWHFDGDIAWEIAQFTWSFNFDSDLKEKVVQLALSTGDEPPEFPEVTWMAASHLVFKPLYGKEAFFNTDVVHIEAFLQAGPAFLSRANTGGRFGYGLDLGAGIRMWVHERMSLRIDLGELIYLVPATSQKATKVSQALHLHLGWALSLWGDS